MGLLAACASRALSLSFQLESSLRSQEFMKWWKSDKDDEEDSVTARIVAARDQAFDVEKSADTPMGRMLAAKAAAAPEPEHAKKKKKKKTVDVSVGHLLLEGDSEPFKVSTFGPKKVDIEEKPVVWAKPDDASSDLTNADELKGKFALVYRGNATYGAKALRAKAAGAVGLIIINTEDKLFVPTDSKGETLEENCGFKFKMPVVMVAAHSFAEGNQRWVASLCYKKGIKLSDVEGQVFSIGLTKQEVRVKKLHVERYKAMYEEKKVEMKAKATAYYSDMKEDYEIKKEELKKEYAEYKEEQERNKEQTATKQSAGARLAALEQLFEGKPPQPGTGLDRV